MLRAVFGCCSASIRPRSRYSAACCWRPAGGVFSTTWTPSKTETHLLDGGTPELAVRFAEPLGDRLAAVLPGPAGAPARETASRSKADGVTVRAQHVIIATPPLLASRIEYEPALPPAHASLLRSYVPGAIIRGISTYDEPFWRADGLTGETFAPGSPVVVSIDQCPPRWIAGCPLELRVRPGRDPPRRARPAGTPAGLARRARQATRPEGPLTPRVPRCRLDRRAVVARGHDRAPADGRPDGVWPRAPPAGRPDSLERPRSSAAEMHGLIEGAVRSGERAADEVLAAG